MITHFFDKLSARVWIFTETVEEKHFRWQKLVTVTVESKQLWPNKESSSKICTLYVWGVNSTVTKHSDHFVWKDMTERMARRCDDTVDKKRVNSCVLKHGFNTSFGGSSATKKIAKKTRNCCLQRATNLTFYKLFTCRALTCVAVCCIMLQYVAVCSHGAATFTGGVQSKIRHKLWRNNQDDVKDVY